LMRQLLPAPRSVDGPEVLEGIFSMPPARRVRANFVISVDGAVELDGRSQSLGGPADRAAFTAMRACADVVLVGAGTVRAEDYGPVKLDEPTRHRRLEHGLAALPRLAVISAKADLDPHARLFSGDSRPLLLTTARSASRRPDLAEVADVRACGDDVLELPVALDCLYEGGLLRVLCEGGPTLLGTLLGHGLLDELCLTISPVFAGPGHRPLATGGALADAATFELLGLLESDGMLLTRYGRAVA